MRALGLTALSIAPLVFATLAAGNDSGISPRTQPSDYPVHDDAKSAVLGAAVIPPEQVKKMFSGDVAKKYIVIEVAVFPVAGRMFIVDDLDFVLRTADQVLRASDPSDVAVLWPGNPDPLANRRPSVTTDTGVFVERGTDPTTGRPRTNVSTYESVAVSNPPPTPPPQPPNNSQVAVDGKLHGMALPGGIAKSPVAGYLYFRINGKKREPLTLNYAKDDVSVDLKLPK